MPKTVPPVSINQAVTNPNVTADTTGNTVKTVDILSDSGLFSSKLLDSYLSQFVDIDEYQNSSCQNGATCVNKLGSFECRCVRGYQGKHCNIGELLMVILAHNNC